MRPRAAHVLGGMLGVLAMTGYIAWKRLAPPPCTGAVFVELRPPLSEPGPYRFVLALDRGDRRCEFEVPLPLRQPVDTKRCGMALALETRVQAGHASILGLTLGAAPEELDFQVRRQSELIYDAHLEPHYAPYATLREESKRFCGERAFVQPQCVRRSSQCAPYPAACSGPAGCPAGKVCCLSPDRAREYGVYAATECSSRRSCLDRFGQIACGRDTDCPDGWRCSDASFAGYFKDPIRGCSDGR